MSFNSFEPACKDFCKGLTPQAKAAAQKKKEEAAAPPAAPPVAPPAPAPKAESVSVRSSCVPPSQSAAGVPPTPSGHCKETCRGLSAQGKAAIQKRKEQVAAAEVAAAGPSAADTSAGVPPSESAATVPTTKSAGGVSETKSAGDGAAGQSVGSNRSGSGGSAVLGGSTIAQQVPTTSPSKAAKARDPNATPSQMQRGDSIISDTYSFVEGEGEGDFDLNRMFMDMLKHPYTKKMLAAAALFILGVKLAKELDYLYMPLRIYDPLKSDALGKML